ncbi:tRNA(Ile)-lysidine synthase [Philodulcilactobacillus myokoensis]|uniref:tRNA(Ile)-lysidine synthase n=1 Tax=Philodulcilactobacillus myokoensis TaxID=2929573 RepID=A0A9W6B1S0_9LACO|nr:tRNA lysidine(34) synthetase TilS [Philodulcilactobacillus myokoensis]GLB47201.1 tRNA(Ile)-lysidine synthase [Philodulcilactobacillus myokoensis]
MNLLKSFASNVNRKKWWQANEPVVIAVSSGVDSMTLLYMIEHLSIRKPQIIVAHVNHELRSASELEERYLKKYCNQHHLNLEVARWPKKYHPASGVENAARNFRYHFFKTVMDKHHSRVIITAHHQNDQAETFMMKLIRGGDISQLIGIRSKRKFYQGILVRPLLGYPKSLLKQFAKKHHIKWYEDVTNHSLKMMRNRMRHILLPRMMKENPAVLDHISEYAEQLNDLINANTVLMNHQLDQILLFWDGHLGKWNLNLICQEPFDLQLELIKLIFHHYFSGIVISSHIFSELLEIINNKGKPQATIQNNQILIKKSYQVLQIMSVNTFLKNRSKKHAELKPFQLKINQVAKINNIKFGIFNHNCLKYHGKRQKVFSLAPSDLPLVVRKWHYGDVIRLKNGGHQKIRRILIDQKVKNEDRESALVLTTHSNRVLALLGYKEASGFSNNPKAHQYTFILGF